VAIGVVSYLLPNLVAICVAITAVFCETDVNAILEEIEIIARFIVNFRVLSIGTIYVCLS